MKKFLFILVFLFFVSCGDPSIMEDTLADPTLTWDAVTTDCVGNPMSGVTYNVYAIQGSGPIPTIQTTDTVPCGIVTIVDTAKIQPLNSAPVTTNTYIAFVSDGVWTFAVEAVSPTGNRGGISNQVTKTVVGRSAGVVNLNVSKQIIEENNN